MRWRFVLSKARIGEVRRKSKETQLSARVSLDGGGRVNVATGLPFLDHMLEQVARYAGVDMKLKGAGDLHVDTHHLVEDAGIVVGQALSSALGDRAGIVRFGSAYAPLDEALARVVVYLGRRPFLSYSVPLRGRIGTLESEVLEEFWKALSIHLGATIHVDVIRGRNRHHVAEATFKALGLALREAMAAGGGLGRRVVELARAGKPLLGVCLGYQLLFEESTEGGRHEGLGLLPGRVTEVQGSEHVPVIGWCRVSQSQPSRLWEGVEDGSYFYFVHSFTPERGEFTIASSDHSPAAASARGTVMGTQFHPEKSGPDGLRVYANFLALCA